jgi:hypothetical protein
MNGNELFAFLKIISMFFDELGAERDFHTNLFKFFVLNMFFAQKCPKSFKILAHKFSICIRALIEPK